MESPIAIVGMACLYPDARSPEELWENALAQRRPFRRIPPERLRLEDYFSADRAAPDSIYSSEAALIEGYEFDRVRFRVSGPTFRSVDPAHWLALDIATQTLEDAGFPSGEGLPRRTAGVFLGNTLTGEFSRANVLRLRWPYVSRVVESALKEEDWPAERREAFLKNLEAAYKSPFPPVGEESLAGGLSNTIAGRIANHYNLQGGCYTLDGACASSLLAVANACAALAAGDLDAALAGGVDLSLDPFELVGFARLGALAAETMRVYDARSDGFSPGEGCGFVLLMRHADALAQGRRVYATIRGWGISSDGSGGITRPEVAGQMLALERAYRRAGFGIETVAYFEGHGTGTSVGDATELTALTQARREAGGRVGRAAVSSVKVNTGHTKAAAGVAGLIKAAKALQHRILPPTGCEEPHPLLGGESPTLRAVRKGEPWPADGQRRAGVSSMGFGGINVHVVLEDDSPAPRRALGYRERALVSSEQDAELFLLGAPDAGQLRSQVEHLSTFAAKLSRAELSDLAAELSRTLQASQARAAVVASGPAELAARLEALKTHLEGGARERVDARAGIYFGAGHRRPRIGFLFPGQSSPPNLGGGMWARRFDAVEELYARSQLAGGGGPVNTSVAQPAIVTASMAALRVLDGLNITAEVAVGHSLGELSALHWAGAFDEEALLRIATARGRLMADARGPAGAMVSISAGRREAEELINGERVVIACLNSPAQTVLSGDAADVAVVSARAVAQKLSAVRLPVSHAFHSPLVAAAGDALAEHLAREVLNPVQRVVVSTVTGEPLTPETNLRELLYRQVTSPVLFMDAAEAAAARGVELWLEVGPGQVLGGLMSQATEVPVVSLDAGGPSLKGLLHAAGAAFALGQPVDHAALTAGRFTRPFSLDPRQRFFVNPCELAPVPETPTRPAGAALRRADEEHGDGASPVVAPGASALSVLTELVAERAELPPSAVQGEHRLLSDLHFNSITVGQIVVEAAQRLGLPRPVSATDYANATVAEIAEALADQSRLGQTARSDDDGMLPAGVDAWVRPFGVVLIEKSLPGRRVREGSGRWRVLAPPEHPLADALRRAFDRCGAGHGVVVCLPPEACEDQIPLLLDGARALVEAGEGARFVLVLHGGGPAAFARTLHLESPRTVTCVVNVPPDAAPAAEWVVAEALAAEGFVESHYDDEGRRREPVMRPLSLAGEPAGPCLNAGDVLLVTGGGKGITAECALALGKETGARLVLLGQARPEADRELAENLERMAAAGVEFRYVSADVTDAGAVRKAVSEIEAEFGPVTGVVHGAARNVPQLIAGLDEASFRRTLAVKVQGLRNILAALDPDKLRLLITFGSIIARTGLPGEADYGVANEELTRLTERWQAAHPDCRCLAVEWSVWSGVGMGARLGRADVLVRQGVTPITADEGVALLRRLSGERLPSVAVVVMGRVGDVPTLHVERPELPLLRFVEQPRVYFPRVELVVDVDLSTGTDPYLNDHQVQDERLLPAVVGLEAMAQVAAAAVGAAGVSAFQEVEFLRPVIVPEVGSRKIRIAALMRADGIVEVALRSDETDFQTDHFRASCRTGGAVSAVECPPVTPKADEETRVAVDPERDLYGDILFHRGRFRRVRGYRLLRAKECVAEIAGDGRCKWFSPYLPGALLLGDPGARDAAVHAIQSCIPHKTLLPVGAEKISLHAAPDCAPLFVHAREREQDGDTFVYDVEVKGADGGVYERWEGLRLRAVRGAGRRGPWALPLLAPYVERRVGELIPGPSVGVALGEWGEGVERRARSSRAMRLALGGSARVVRRPDGRPEASDGRAVSAAHTGELTLAVAGRGPLGCDIEQVAERPAAAWRGLLGDDGVALAGLVARHAGEDEATAATRVWAARECLKKAGAAFDAPLLFAAAEADGWVLFSAGDSRLATYAADIRGRGGRTVIAALPGSDDARL
jgi:enediyne polyketide synthase